jgi:hypothetical protein
MTCSRTSKNTSDRIYKQSDIILILQKHVFKKRACAFRIYRHTDIEGPVVNRAVIASASMGYEVHNKCQSRSH